MEKIFVEADKQLSPVRGVVVHRSPAWFMVDGGKKTLEPVGMKGSELKALVSFVVADTFFLDDIMARLRDLNIAVSGFFSSCTGEAMLYLLEEDRDRTAILIDIGYTCTDVMVVEGDAVIFQKSMPVGGGHIAADIAEGLKIPLTSAEQIKREYVYGVSGKNQSYSVSLGEGVKQESFQQEDVAAVLEPRVDEISDMIKSSIDESGIKPGNWSTIFLTGGGLALNRGGRDYLSGTARQARTRNREAHHQAFQSHLCKRHGVDGSDHRHRRSPYRPQRIRRRERLLSKVCLAADRSLYDSKFGVSTQVV